MRDGEAVPSTLFADMANVIRARAERLLDAEFCGAIIDHYTSTLCSDADLMEGVSPEMIVLIDDGGITIVSPLTLADCGDQLVRFRRHGRNGAIAVRHQQVIAAAMAITKAAKRPTLIACSTTIGSGAPTTASTAKAHDEPLGAAQIAGALNRCARNRYEWLAADDRGRGTASARHLAPGRGGVVIRSHAGVARTGPRGGHRRGAGEGAVMAAVRFGCAAVIGPDGGFIGICGRGGVPRPSILIALSASPRRRWQPRPWPERPVASRAVQESNPLHDDALHRAAIQGKTLPNLTPSINLT